MYLEKNHLESRQNELTSEPNIVINHLVDTIHAGQGCLDNLESEWHYILWHKAE